MLEGLARLLERSAEEASVQAVRQGIVDQKLEALGGKLSTLEALAGQMSTLEVGLGQRMDGVADLAAERMVALLGDGFPVLKTSRPELLREVELDLVGGLAPWLTPRVAFDVGAHHGPFSEALLDAGFEVHALEPNPTTCDELERRLGGRTGFQAHQLAAGSEESEAQLALVSDPTGDYIDPSQFASLSGLAPPPGLVSAGTVRVKVRRLDSLVCELGIVAPSFIKVDAEGTDLEVMRGLGNLRPAVLQVEFWDESLPFSGPGATNRVSNLVAQAKQQGLPWHLVVFRRWGDDRAAFYSARTGSPERSWGNVIFFAEQAMYERARQVLAAALPEARFVPASKS
jgi:FkbM family methyltransferase